MLLRLGNVTIVCVCVCVCDAEVRLAPPELYIHLYIHLEVDLTQGMSSQLQSGFIQVQAVARVLP